MYQGGGFEDSHGLVKAFFISGSSGLDKSRFARFGKINIINGKSINSIYAQRQKMERHMISLIQSIRRKNVTIFDDIDATSFGFRVVTYLTGQHHKDFFTIHKQRHGFHIMQSSQKASRLEVGERVASQSSEYEKDKKRSRSTS